MPSWTPKYPTKVKVSDEEMEKLNLTKASFPTANGTIQSDREIRNRRSKRCSSYFSSVTNRPNQA